MFKLGESIPASPSLEFAPGLKAERIGKGKVIYIHPAGRFYTLEFQGAQGAFCETRYFDPSELKAGYRAGLFPKLNPAIFGEGEDKHPEPVTMPKMDTADPVFF